MITSPIFPDLLRPGAPVQRRLYSSGKWQAIVWTVVGFDDRGVHIAQTGGPDDCGAIWPENALRLILDDEPRIGDHLARAFLGRRLGVPMPAVGGPVWRRCNWMLDRQVESYFLGISGEFVVVFGPQTDLTKGNLQCPTLPDPDSADAPIRALALAMETVGGAS